MGTINIHNYELFFLDFAEGNLSKSQIKDLNNFLLQNPNLKKELDSFENLQLLPEDIKYEYKDELIKQTQSELFDITNFEYLAVAEIENDISNDEKEELYNITSKNSKLNLEFNIFKKTTLKNYENIIYPLKTQLKRRTIYDYVKTSSYAVAAIIALFLTLNIFIFNKTNNVTSIASVINLKNKTIKPVKNIKTYKEKQIKENKKQKFSNSHNQTNSKLTTNKIFAFDDNGSHKNADIYNKLNVSIPSLKTETLIFEKNNSEIEDLQSNIAYTNTRKPEKDKVWKYAEAGIKMWKIVSSSDIEMNNKYKTDGSIGKLDVYASNIRFSKTFNR